MGRYFKVTEIPFDEFEKYAGHDIGEYDALLVPLGDCAYYGANENMEEIRIPLSEVPPMAAEADGESTNNSKPSDCMNCVNLGSICDKCKDVHESKWEWDWHSPETTNVCQSCRHKYCYVDDEPCVKCGVLMQSYFKEES